MAESLQILLSIVGNTPLPTLLVIGGIVFLFFSIVDVTQIKVQPERRKTAAKWGTIMLLAGILLFAAPPISTALVSTATATDQLSPTLPPFTSPSTVTVTPAATFTAASTATLTLTPTFTSTPSPTQSCNQLKGENFKITSPTGPHGNVTDGSIVTQLNEHMPITWEPSYCPLTIKVFRGGVPVRTYESKQSGEITTDFLVTDYPSFTSGAWIEIKVWIPGASLPSDNVHIKLP